jgi:hypothetical protein
MGEQLNNYTVTLECIDLMVDWAEFHSGDIKFKIDDGGLTESKVFVNTGNNTRHTALDLLGAWIAGTKLADHTALISALFAPGSESTYAIKRIKRPTKAGDDGFVTFEIAHKVSDSWAVETDRGILPALEIRLMMRAGLLPVH